MGGPRTIFCLAALGIACQSPDAAHTVRDRGGRDAGAGGGPAREADAEADGAGRAPSPTDAEWALLRELSRERPPPAPPDPTNRVADDDAASAFGQRLFYDPGFSGPLLDADNDGSPKALGVSGQTGRVACAGCHVPDGGFSDTRSFQRQISLGAGWGRRRAPSLLDVGQARLVMWDGRHDTLYGQIF